MALGIDNLKKAAKLLVSFGKEIETAAKGGFQITDLFGFIDEISQIPEIINNKTAILEEFKDLTAEERSELLEYVKIELVLEDKNLENIIETALVTGISLLALVEAIRANNKPAEEPVA